MSIFFVLCLLVLWVTTSLALKSLLKVKHLLVLCGQELLMYLSISRVYRSLRSRPQKCRVYTLPPLGDKQQRLLLEISRGVGGKSHSVLLLLRNGCTQVFYFIFKHTLNHPCMFCMTLNLKMHWLYQILVLFSLYFVIWKSCDGDLKY